MRCLRSRLCGPTARVFWLKLRRLCSSKPFTDFAATESFEVEADAERAKTPPKPCSGEGAKQTPLSERPCKYFLSESGCKAGNLANGFTPGTTFQIEHSVVGFVVAKIIANWIANYALASLQINLLVQEKEICMVVEVAQLLQPI